MEVIKIQNYLNLSLGESKNKVEVQGGHHGSVDISHMNDKTEKKDKHGEKESSEKKHAEKESKDKNLNGQKEADEKNKHVEKDSSHKNKNEEKE